MAKRKKQARKASEIIDPRVAKALANEQRVEILSVLSHTPMSPVRYEREYGGDLSSLAYHFKVLEGYACVELAETVKRRGALEHVYRCTMRPLLAGGDWKLLPPTVRGSISGAILQTLLDHAGRALEKGSFEAREDRRLDWAPLQVDEKGWKEATSLLAATLAKLGQIEERSAARLAKSKKEPVPITVGLLCFESPAEASS